MKKTILLIICLVLIFALCGCSKKTDPVDMNRIYSVDAEVQMGDFSANVGLNRLGNGAWDISFTKPDNLNGLAITYQNDKADVSFNGLNFSINREDIPVNAIVSSLTNVLENAAYGRELSFTKKDGKITVKGKVEDTDYVLTLDEKTNSLLELDIKKQNLHVTFSGYKLMT